MAKLKSLRRARRGPAMPSSPFVGANGFDLMHGAQIPSDIASPTPRFTDNSKPPLVPGTGMALGMSGRP